MIKVSVLYAAGEGKTFDMEYYCATHMPMVQDKLGAALKSMAVEEGVAGGAPGTPPAYAAMCHLQFESVDAFQSAFGPHANAIMGDIPNFTNVEPTVQISNVRI
jgi:uncharacterized protein (TIGR02118 family)